MASLLTRRARAYVNHGRWVADCPGDYCNSARTFDLAQRTFHCVDCLTVAVIEWPDRAEAVWQALCRRPNPANRNWFPQDHPLALAANQPHGQSVADLYDENAEHGVS